MPTENVRILHLSDLHLGFLPSFLGGKGASRSRERDTVLKRAVDLSLDGANRVDMVIIVGDLFDVHRPDAALVEYAIGELQRLAAHVHVITVPGNHDEITYNDSVYRLEARRWPGTLVQNPMPQLLPVVEVRGVPVHVYSLAYTGGVTETAPPLSRFPREEAGGIHVAAFHGSLGWDGNDRSLPIDRDALGRSGYDYVALGHFHRESEMQLASGGKAVYAGMIEGRTFADPGTGRFVVAEVRPGNAKIEHIQADTRELVSIELDVTTAAGLDDVGRAVRSAAQSHRDAIMRVTLAGSPAFAIDAGTVTARTDGACYHLEIEVAASQLTDEAVALMATEPTIRGEFVRRLLQRAGTTDTAIFRRALVRGLRALEGGGAR